MEITSQDIEGWLVANSGNITVALDIKISEELRKEGIARELVNRIQNIRKDSGFEVTDKIKVYIQRDAAVEEAIRSNEQYIKRRNFNRRVNNSRKNRERYRDCIRRSKNNFIDFKVEIMMTQPHQDEQVRYSDADLAEFKEIILRKDLRKPKLIWIF